MSEIALPANGSLAGFLDFSSARSVPRLRRPLSHGKHLPPLDTVRGIAVLLVMGFHFAMISSTLDARIVPLARLAVLGRCGVDLFFVLSGFLITGILYDSKEAVGYFKVFYLRRAVRIMPLYYVALALLLFVMPLVLGRVPAAINDDLKHQGWLWLHGLNLGLIWFGPSHFGMIGHLWSLSIEEQFYLIWPLAVFWLNRTTLVRVCIGTIIGSLLLRSVLMSAGDNSWICYLLTPCRFDQLAIGALAALAARGPTGLTPLIRPARWIAPIGFITLLAIFALRDKFHDPQHADILMPTIGYSVVGFAFGACIVLAAVSRESSAAGRVMYHPFLRMFGKYSYALYIFHPLVFIFVLSRYQPMLSGKLTLPFALLLLGGVCFTLSLAIAWTSWHLLEKHFLKLKRYFNYAKPAPSPAGDQRLASVG